VPAAESPGGDGWCTPGLAFALRAIYRAAWEVSMRSLIDMAAGRGAFIDQSASLNLFMESPSIGAMSSMYMHAWKQGIKTTYYLRSRPATRIGKATVATTTAAPAPAYTDGEAAPACWKIRRAAKHANQRGSLR
jgi:hypothetical protein